MFHQSKIKFFPESPSSKDASPTSQFNRLLKSREIGERNFEYKTEEMKSIAHESSNFHFYGERLSPEHIQNCKNVYQVIKQFQLGNLSQFSKIPQFYVRFLLGFIIQISRALSHAHKNDLVHSNLDLSKVLAQKISLSEKKQSKMCFKKNHDHQNEKKQFIDHSTSNYNFQLSNFEPYQIYKVMKKTVDNAKGTSLKLNSQDIAELLAKSRQLLKIKDLNTFSNCIIEIMVGKFEETSLQVRCLSSLHTTQNEFHKIKMMKNGALPLDIIPLIWIKTPGINQIFDLLNILFSSYNRTNSINVDTSNLLDKLGDIASGVYQSNFSLEDGMDGSYQYHPMSLDFKNEARLLSHELNNKAVIAILNITEDSSQFEQGFFQKQASHYLEKSIFLAPENQTALLNYNLLQWSQGKKTDLQFVQFIQTKLFQIDREFSILIYLLFKKNVIGIEPTEHEIMETIKIFSSENCFLSNISKLTFEHPDFFPIVKKTIKHPKIGPRLAFIKTNFAFDSRCYVSQVIPLEKKFQAKSISFSNNDIYLVLIGKSQLQIVDARYGDICFFMRLPLFSDGNPKPRAGGIYQNSKVLNPQIQQLQAYQTLEINLIQAKESIGENSSSEEDEIEIKSEASPQFSNPKRSETNISETIAALQKPVILPTEPAAREKAELRVRFPQKWQSNLHNTGKVLALFDQAQQKRSLAAKYEQNKVEALLVYTIVLNQKVSIPTQEACLDMRQMLEGQEVLNFGLDDWVQGSFSIICVQAKDLCIYVIDFVQRRVLRRLKGDRHFLLNKSIMRRHNRREKNQEHYEQFKEFVEQQEHMGNTVLIPKVNEDVLLIRQKGTNLIMVYNIRTKKVVRKFELTLAQITFPGAWSEEGAPRSTEDGSFSGSLEDSVTESGGGDVIAKAMAEEEAEKRKKAAQRREKREPRPLPVTLLATLGSPEHSLRKAASIRRADTLRRARPAATSFHGELPIPPRPSLIQDSVAGSQSIVDQDGSSVEMLENTYSFLSSTSENENEEIKAMKVIMQLKGQAEANHDKLIRKTNKFEQIRESIDLLDVAPQATYIACVIDNELFIKVINQVRNTQRQYNLAYHQAIPFIPLYLDEDYNYAANKRKWHDHYKNRLKPDIQFNLHRGVQQRDLVQVFAAYRQLSRPRPNTTLYSSQHSHQLELLQKVVRWFLADPGALERTWPRGSDPQQITARLLKVAELCRNFQNIGKEHVSKVDARGAQAVAKFDRFQLIRSDDYCHGFAVAQQATHFLMAALVGRQVHVYNYITGAILFKVSARSVSAWAKRSNPSQNLAFMDADQVVCMQTGRSRIKLLNVEVQTANYAKTQIKHQIPLEAYEELEGPNFGSTIEVGFGVDKDGVPYLDDDLQDNELKAKESDLEESLELGEVDIEVGQDIQAMEVSSVYCQKSRLAVLCNMRFQIYQVSGDEPIYLLLWDLNYKLMNNIAKWGSQTCLDFHRDEDSFTTSSNIGAICVWSLKDRELTKSYIIEHPATAKALSISIVRDCSKHDRVICYSQSLNRLFTNQRFSKEVQVEVEQHSECPVDKRNKKMMHGNTVYVQTLNKIHFKDFSNSSVVNKNSAGSTQSLQSSDDKKQPFRIGSKTLIFEGGVQFAEQNDSISQKSSEKTEKKTVSPPGVEMLSKFSSNLFNNYKIKPRYKTTLKFIQENDDFSFSKSKGQVKQLKIEKDQDFLVSSFTDGSICIFDILSCDHVCNIMPSTQMKFSQILCIDDFCTLYGVLQPDKQSVSFNYFNWQYEVEKYGQQVYLEFGSKDRRKTLYVPNSYLFSPSQRSKTKQNEQDSFGDVKRPQFKIDLQKNEELKKKAQTAKEQASKVKEKQSKVCSIF